MCACKASFRTLIECYLLEQRRYVVGGDLAPVLDDAGHMTDAHHADDAARLVA